MHDPNAVRQQLESHGQDHLLKHLDSLGQSEQQRLLEQIAALDLTWLARTFEAHIAAVTPEQIAPYREVIHPGDPDAEAARQLGHAAIKEGRVGTLLVAGGQGTRLGFNGPKGAFPIGAISGRTLYQIHAERLLALGRRHGTVPPLYLMTSEANHDATCELFAQCDNFGLPAERLLIFQQGLAPAVDEQGRLLLNAPDHIVMTPNGNGGLFDALRDRGAFAHMHDCGVDTISYIQVDNPLAASCDPLFVGFHLLRESQYSCKAIDKVGPTEKVGTYALVDGRLRVVEYNEIPAEMARITDDRGALLYGHSNPGLFVWSRAFAETQAARDDLPYHKAHKKIPHLDDAGVLVRPQSPCGYKFEAFAMDTLPDAERSLLLWCDRDQEFAPVKNAEGVDSPASAQKLMTALYADWLRRAGATLPEPPPPIEINPLYALDAEELSRRLEFPCDLRGATYLRP